MKIIGVICAAFLLFPAACHAQQLTERGLFVSVIEKEQVLAGKANIERLINYAAKARIKTLFVQVYRANMAWFPSTTADRSPYDKALKAVGEDPFALLIKKAHAKGIEVHAWLNLLSLSKNIQAPILKEYGPQILTRNIAPKKALEDYAIDSQYFLEPGDPRVQKELETVIGDILTAYPDLDGIQFDYIRYPDAHPFYGHTPVNISNFKKATKAKAVRDDDLSWKDWKRSRVTALLQALVKKVRSINSKVHISTTGCMSYSRAREEAFQDWAVWLEQGLAEFVTVMSYPDNMPEFKKNITDSRKRSADFKKINIGVGAYKFIKDPETFIQQFEFCEEAGPGQCVVFYYGSLNENKDMLEYLTQPLRPKEL